MSHQSAPTLLTGWAALPVIREADQAYFAGDIARRNALLLTVDPEFWNGREILDEAPRWTSSGKPVPFPGGAR